MSEEIRAAGGVVHRPSRSGPQFCVVHRPRHDDWSLPKGKLDEGEGFEQAALREVAEETGLRCTLGQELPAARYPVDGRPKVVRYWLMSLTGEPDAETDQEVDELRWLGAEAAAALLSYPHDVELVAEAARRLADADDHR